MSGVNLSDRIISVLSYYTCGIFSLIWIVFANITGKKITPFLMFNVYQAIFVSVVLAAISFLYQIAINVLAVIPFIGGLVKSFNVFFNATPVYFGFTISGLIVTIFLTYLSIYSLLGKRPFVPFVSDMVNMNFGG